MSSKRKKKQVLVLLILIFFFAAFLCFKAKQKPKLVEPAKPSQEEKKDIKKEMSA